MQEGEDAHDVIFHHSFALPVITADGVGRRVYFAARTATKKHRNQIHLQVAASVLDERVARNLPKVAREGHIDPRVLDLYG